MRHANWLVAVLVATSTVTACKEEPSAPAAASASAAPEPVVIPEDKLAMFAPLPEVVVGNDNPVTDAKVDLGHTLFFDERLSKNHDVSCNTCHGLSDYGVDGKPVSVGHRGQKGGRNAPTVYNAAAHLAQFWDGRAGDVEEQAKGPVLNPTEMAMPNEGAVLDVLRSMPGYVEAFAKAFPDEKDPITYDNFGKAVGAFERKLLTPSRWDALLRGDKKALTDREKRGFLKFAEIGCPTCHTGMLVGGSTYQKVGVTKPWPNQDDKGREELTNQPIDRMMFKVPSLRNVAKTGPYFHDASAETLEDAVAKMAAHQLAKKLPDEDVALIVTWLNVLTGELPTQYTSAPKLPASTDRTPKPDPH